MEENNEQNNNTNTEEVKEEIKNTTNETAKEETKNTTNETAKAKGTKTKNNNSNNATGAVKEFFVNIFKTPYDEVKKVSQAPKKYWIVVVIIFATWILAKLIGGIISIVSNVMDAQYWTSATYFRNSFREILSMFTAILTPAVIIAVISLIIFLLMKNKKKNYLTIASTLIVAYAPVATASVISLLGNINSNISKFTSSYSGLCSVLTAVLVYFAIKALYEEKEDNKVIKTFFITMAIYYAFVFVLKLFGPYI